jgi:hypothetical protein
MAAYLSKTLGDHDDECLKALGRGEHVHVSSIETLIEQMLSDAARDGGIHGAGSTGACGVEGTVFDQASLSLFDQACAVPSRGSGRWRGCICAPEEGVKGPPRPLDLRPARERGVPGMCLGTSDALPLSLA